MACRNLKDEFCSKAECSALSRRITDLQNLVISLDGQLQELRRTFSGHVNSSVCGGVHGGITACLPALKKGLKGDKGDPGTPGKDAKPIKASVVQISKNCVKITVGDYASTICVKDGLDGKPGKDRTNNTSNNNNNNNNNNEPSNETKKYIDKKINDSNRSNTTVNNNNTSNINNTINNTTNQIITTINSNNRQITNITNNLEKNVEELVKCCSALKNKQERDYTNILNMILETTKTVDTKVTIDADILNGHCEQPEEEGNWYEYIPDKTTPVKNISSAIVALSGQIKKVHEDTCKAVQPKITLNPLSIPFECVKNEDTGKLEVKEMGIGGSISKLPSWLLPILTFLRPQTIIPTIGTIIISRILNALWDSLISKDKTTLERECDIKNYESITPPDLMSCLPKIAQYDSTEINKGNKGYNVNINTNRDPNGTPNNITVFKPEYNKDGDVSVRTPLLYEIYNSLGYIPDYILRNEPKKDLTGIDALLFTIGDYFQYFKATEALKLVESCKKLNDNADNMECVMLSDDKSIHLAYDYYLTLHWKWEDTTLTSGIRANVLVNPLQIFIDGTNPDNIWNTYFDSAYKILGEQNGVLWQVDEKGRYIKQPLQTGYFENIEEARRYFAWITTLTTSIPKPVNNPSFPQHDKKQTHITNTGKKLVLKKVCVNYKAINSNESQVINVYAKPTP